jgi:hypothetical protein
MVLFEIVLCYGEFISGGFVFLSTLNKSALSSPHIGRRGRVSGEQPTEYGPFKVRTRNNFNTWRCAVCAPAETNNCSNKHLLYLYPKTKIAWCYVWHPAWREITARRLPQDGERLKLLSVPSRLHLSKSTGQGQHAADHASQGRSRDASKQNRENQCSKVEKAKLGRPPPSF